MHTYPITSIDVSAVRRVRRPRPPWIGPIPPILWTTSELPCQRSSNSELGVLPVPLSPAGDCIFYRKERTQNQKYFSISSSSFILLACFLLLEYCDSTSRRPGKCSDGTPCSAALLVIIRSHAQIQCVKERKGNRVSTDTISNYTLLLHLSILVLL